MKVSHLDSARSSYILAEVRPHHLCLRHACQPVLTEHEVGERGGKAHGLFDAHLQL